ncbi:hypothetical protein AB0C27_41965 [Nonomuraea sp. NPDC048882]|uniref:hypothetical protein n=1 Tax=unclassified Nonomuraea TaxID=2593643 RepID=UPI0033EC5364
MQAHRPAQRLVEDVHGQAGDRPFAKAEVRILVVDEFDSMSLETIKELLDPGDPVGSLLQAIRAYEAMSEGASEPSVQNGPWRRVPYFFAEPSVRMAVCATLDRAGGRIAPLLAETCGLSPTQARVLANALAFGYFAALEQWHLDGGTGSIADYVEEGMRPLRDVWSATRPPSAHGPADLS